MRLFNQTKNIILAEELIMADTLLKRLIGLLGRREFKEGQALVLKPANSIHTFFMRFPIDVLFIDGENKVIKAVSCLKPWRISGIYLRSRMTVELPCGILQKTSVSEGDAIILCQ